jgi:hypothetical protein
LTQYSTYQGFEGVDALGKALGGVYVTWVLSEEGFEPRVDGDEVFGGAGKEG